MQFLVSHIAQALTFNVVVLLAADMWLLRQCVLLMSCRARAARCAAHNSRTCTLTSCCPEGCPWQYAAAPWLPCHEHASLASLHLCIGHSWGAGQLMGPLCNSTSLCQFGRRHGQFMACPRSMSDVLYMTLIGPPSLPAGHIRERLSRIPEIESNTKTR